MRGSQTVATVLIGWSLMLPRYDLDGRVEDKAPLSEWKIYSTYESREDCEGVRNQMVEIANEFIGDQEKRAEMDGIAEASVMLAAKCVGS